jgi:hypothetical protein
MSPSETLGTTWRVKSDADQLTVDGERARDVCDDDPPREISGTNESREYSSGASPGALGAFLFPFPLVLTSPYTHSCLWRSQWLHLGLSVLHLSFLPTRVN